MAFQKGIAFMPFYVGRKTIDGNKNENDKNEPPS